MTIVQLLNTSTGAERKNSQKDMLSSDCKLAQHTIKSHAL